MSGPTFRGSISNPNSQGQISSGESQATLCTLKSSSITDFQRDPPFIQLYCLEYRILALLMESKLVRFISLVKSLQEGWGLCLSVILLGPVIVEPIDSVVIEDSLGWHEVFVKVADLRELPFCVVQQLIADVHSVIDAFEVSQMCISSEVVSQVNFCLLGGGPVLASSK